MSSREEHLDQEATGMRDGSLARRGAVCGAVGGLLKRYRPGAFVIRQLAEIA